MSDKVQKLEKQMYLMKQQLRVILPTKPSSEDCENKIYDSLGNKLEMDIQNVLIERAHRTRNKNENGSRPITAQFSFFKDKINILKNCKKLENRRFYIFDNCLQGKMVRISCQKGKSYDIVSKLLCL